jgi:glucokinase
MTPTHGRIELFVEDLVREIKNLTISASSQHPGLEILGIGIGAPNANYYTGQIEHAPNLSFKGIIPFVDMLKTRLPAYRTIVLTNDANAAALGEMQFGGAKGMKHFILFTLGTGVGSGLVVDGKLVYGYTGFAGEYGHTMLMPEGRLCGCGQRGHVEAYCSAIGMKRTVFELLARDNATNSLLANVTFNDLTSKMIYEAALKGDPIALETFEKTGYWLGMALADAVHHFSPEAIFLFGGPTAAGAYLFEPTRKSMEDHLIPVFRQKVKLLLSELPIREASILGAAAMVFSELDARN